MMKIRKCLFCQLLLSILIYGTGYSQDSGATQDQTPKKKATFVNELPKDLADDSLVVMLLEGYSEANRNKNAKYREFFQEYPYPVLFVLPSELVSATQRHPYLLTYIDHKDYR